MAELTKHEQEYMLKTQLVLSLEGTIETLQTLESLGKLNASEHDAVHFLASARSMLNGIYEFVKLEHDRRWGTRLCRADALNRQTV